MNSVPNAIPATPGYDAPPQRQPEAGANEAERQRERLEVADEPGRALMTDLAVAFVVGHVVDGARFDPADSGGFHASRPAPPPAPAPSRRCPASQSGLDKLSRTTGPGSRTLPSWSGSRAARLIPPSATWRPTPR